MGTRLRRPSIALLAIGAVTAAVVGCTVDRPVERATGLGAHRAAEDRSATSVPAEVAAANGPLVGDADATAAELSCLAGTANAPWSPTMAPFEVHDSGRSHLYGCATFLGSTDGDNTVFAHPSEQTYVTPYNMVTPVVVRWICAD